MPRENFFKDTRCRFACGSEGGYVLHVGPKGFISYVDVFLLLSLLLFLKGIIVKKMFQLITAAVAQRTPKRSEGIRTSKERRQMEAKGSLK